MRQRFQKKLKSRESDFKTQKGMRSHQVLGVVLLVLGLAILYFLRGTVEALIVFVLEFLGVLLGIILILVGLALLFLRRRVWRVSF
jgi:polyferredoxin